MNKIQGVYKVVSNENLCSCFKRMCIDADVIKNKVLPGQFIHIKVNDTMQPFFRRPFSVYRAKRYIEIFYEVVGMGTEILSYKKEGDLLDIIGPVGQGFTLPSKEIKNVVMVAGGIGIAPFLALSDVLKDKNVKMTLLYGGRTKDHVYEMQEFKDNSVNIFVSTDDGGYGVKGRVSELFDEISLDPQSTFVYTCGPHPLMHAVQKFCKEHKLSGEAACEEVMACALGACLGCSIKTTKGFRTVCHDGPVFDLQEILF